MTGCSAGPPQPDDLAQRLRTGIARARAETPADVVVADPAARFEPFPLTDLQEAYVLGRQGAFELSGVGSQVCYELDVTGVDPDRFRHAWDVLVGRHDMLRAVVTPDGRQRVLPDIPPLDIPLLELDDESHQELLAALETRVHDPRSWPLFDVRLVRLHGGLRAVVVVDVLLCDGQGLHVLMRDLHRLCYEPDAVLAPLGLTFRDYQIHRHGRRSGAGYERARAYWHDRLPMLPPPPQLPYRTTVPGPQFVRREAVLTTERWQRLQRAGTEAGLTPSVVLLSAYAEVLAAWSAHSDFTLTLTLFNRLPLHPQVDEVIGDFSATSLLEVAPPAGAAFSERAAWIQEQVWRDLEHEAVSGVATARELSRVQGRPSAAVAPVVFTSLLRREGSLHLPWPLLHGSSRTPQVTLDHQAVPDPAGLRLIWECREEAFLPGVLDAMFDAYLGWLTRLATEPSAWSYRPALLPQDQASRREATLGPAAPAPTGLLHDGFLSSCARTPGAVAVSGPDEAWSYAELKEHAAAVAADLLDRGVHRGDRVAVMLPPGAHQLAAILGTLMVAATYVPVDLALPESRRRELLARSRPAAVLDDVRGSSGGDVGPVPGCATGGDIAYVIYTSGSTGGPKGVVVDHAAALNTVTDVNRRFGVSARDRVLALSPAGFDLSVYDVFGLLDAGGTVVYPGADASRDPGRWLESIDTEAVTIWNTAPALLQMLVHYAEGVGAAPRDSVRLVLLSGDWIPLDLPHRARALFPSAEVVSLGGATECAIWSIHYPITDVAPEWASIPYGYPLLNQHVGVYDELGRPCPDWVTGSIEISGSGLAQGYLDAPVETARRFRPDPDGRGSRRYGTGDLGRYRPDGAIEFLGRVDGQVKVRGHRIEVAEVEAALVEHPDVIAAAVLAPMTDDHTRCLVALVVPRHDDLSAQELRGFVAARLPAAFVPSRVELVPALPLTPNGKLDRNALVVPDAVTASSATPRTDAVDVVAQCWAEVLQSRPPDPEDDFFACGGNSMTAMRLLERVRERWGGQVSLADFFAAPTVAGLAATLPDRRARSEPSTTARDAGAPDAPFRLTGIQEAYLVGRQSHFDLGGVAPHTYLELSGPELDVDRFVRAWTILVRRHDMLRCVVRGGRQQVLPMPDSVPVTVEDLSRVTPDGRERALAALREEMSARVHDPGTWPLFDVRVCELGEAGVRVLLEIDLLVADAWSLAVVERELGILYDDPDAELPALGVSFRDYVHREVDGARVGESRAYWRERVAALPGPPALPVHPLPPGRTPRFVRRSTVLSAEDWARLRASVADAGVTPSVLGLAALAEVLGRWSETSRFLLNVTVFHRDPVHPDVDGLVGDFTTLSPLGVDVADLEWPAPGEPLLGGEAAFGRWVSAIQGRLWEDLDHRFEGGIETIRLLAAVRQERLGALAPVVFTSTLDIAPADAALPRLPLVPGYGVSQTPQVWLDHQLVERDGALLVHWDAVEEMFPPGLLDELVAEHARLLASLVRDTALARAPRQRSTTVALPRPADEDATTPTTRRASVRHYATDRLPVRALGDLLANVLPDTVAGGRRYASAGGLYPVEIHLVVAPERVEGLPAGRYRHDARTHELHRLGPALPIPPVAPDVRRGTTNDPAFALALIGRMDEVAARYGDLADGFAMLEAGMLTQLLETSAGAAGLGLCQAGGVDFAAVGLLAGLPAGHRGLHVLVGGGLPTPVDSRRPVLVASPEARRSVRDAWSAALGRDVEDDSADFFELGGNSVNLIEVHAALYRRTGTTLPVADMFRRSSLLAHAVLLDAAVQGGRLDAASEVLDRARHRGLLRRGVTQRTPE
jgi:yersiniabactin nonribosomal peptide synthetase